MPINWNDAPTTTRRRIIHEPMIRIQISNCPDAGIWLPSSYFRPIPSYFHITFIPAPDLGDITAISPRYWLHASPFSFEIDIFKSELKRIGHRRAGSCLSATSTLFLGSIGDEIDQSVS